MDIFYLDSLLDLATSVKDSLGVAALDICLDPDRWVLEFDSLEVYGEFLWLCWVSVWDQFNRQSFVPPTVTAALFVSSRRLLRFRDLSVAAMPECLARCVQRVAHRLQAIFLRRALEARSIDVVVLFFSTDKYYGEIRLMKTKHFSESLGNVTSLRQLQVLVLCIPQEVEAWKSGHVGQRVPKYFLLYIRIAGASQRGLSKLCIAKLPYVLVAPKAKPPVESKQDVQASRLLARINAGTTCYTDGNRSWKAVAKDVKKQILVKSVSHRNAQFTKNLKGPKRKGYRWDSAIRSMLAPLEALRCLQPQDEGQEADQCCYLGQSVPVCVEVQCLHARCHGKTGVLVT